MIYAFRDGDRFLLVFERGSGECASGCTTRDYFYFDVALNCEPALIERYMRRYEKKGNCYAVSGRAMWGVPEDLGGVCPRVAGLNEDCGAECPKGLSKLYYYGFDGSHGPRSCVCGISCADDESVCPPGTTCVLMSDGPGRVCHQEELMH